MMTVPLERLGRGSGKPEAKGKLIPKGKEVEATPARFHFAREKYKDTCCSYK